MGQLTDIKKIGYQPAHHLAGIILIVVGIGHRHILVEQILPHVRLHTGSHNMAVGGHIELAQGPQNIPQKQRGKQPLQRRKDTRRAAGKQPLRQPPENLRKRKVDHAQYHCAEYVHKKELLVRPVVTYKPPEY